MVVLVLRQTVDFHIPAEVDIQPVVARIHTGPVQFPVDTVYLVVVDIVMVANIVVDRVPVLEQDRMFVLQEDMELVQNQQWDTGLIVMNCREVGLQDMVLGYPCVSL